MDDRIVQQVMDLAYLDVEISSVVNTALKPQALKGVLISGCLRQVTWKNKYAEGKVKIYKTIVRPTTTYAAETQANTSRTKQLLRTTEMNTLRAMVGKQEEIVLNHSNKG